MAIAFNKYINITSEVGAGETVTTRDLIGRLFTVNTLAPTGTVLQFNSAQEVASYFGTSSEEYLRALFYFSWISKNATRPQLISYSFWASAATAPLIFGQPLTATLGQLQAITTGSFNLTLGGISHDLTGLNFSTDMSFAAIAATIQVAVRAADGSSQWTAADVTYNSGSNAFNLVGGATGAATVATAMAASGVDIRALIGWLSNSALIYPSAPILSNGVAIETITATLTNSANISNNFGSFLFTTSAGLDQAQIVEAATWNYGQSFTFMYTIPCSAGNAGAYSTALKSIGFAALTLAPLSTEYPEQIPMQIFAATDYNSVNAVQNYMFQMANVTASVTDTTNSDSYDSIGVNYYGQTQTAGQLIAFYQRGVLTGEAINTNPTDMNVYANEIWLRDAAGAALMTLVLALPEISANNQGIVQVLGALQSVINQAVSNGTISVGTILTQSQKTYITEITGNDKAWQQIQNIGYWTNAQVTQSTETIDSISTITYAISYILVYKKDDIIRMIDGSHFLI